MDARPPQVLDSWSIARLLAWTAAHLESKHVDEPRLSAELLLAEAMHCRRIDLYARFDQEPSAEQRSVFRDLVRAAGEHRPIAHLIGHREFYSLDFHVTPDVLIPRPETELVVERALAWCADHPAERHELLDVGVGSGCITIAAAKRCPTLYALATDISAPALAVAADNAARHGVADRVRCLQADLLDLPAEAVPEGGFELIVSNPPYIGERERESLPRNVRDYEPAAALFSGADGLDVFRRLAADVRRHLRPDGTLILEVGHTQADAVQKLFTEQAGLTFLARYKDLSGIDRVLQFAAVSR